MSLAFPDCENIYVGQDILATITDRGSRNVAISFSSRGHSKTDDPRYGSRLFAKLNISVIFIIPLADHWWQTEEMEIALDIINRRISSISERVTYGQSMGGFGAIAFAEHLMARYVATSPQICIDPTVAPLRSSWTHDIGQRPLRYPCAATLVRRARGLLAYDPTDKIDSWHAARLLGSDGDHTPFVVPFSGHYLPRTLNEMGLLAVFASSAISGDFNTIDLRRAVRQRRLLSRSYLKNIINKAKRRRIDGLLFTLLRYISNKIITSDKNVNITRASDAINELVMSLRHVKYSNTSSVTTLTNVFGPATARAGKDLTAVPNENGGFIITDTDPQIWIRPAIPSHFISHITIQIYTSTSGEASLYWRDHENAPLSETNSLKRTLTVGTNRIDFDLSQIRPRGSVRFDPLSRNAFINMIGLTVATFQS